MVVAPPVDTTASSSCLRPPADMNIGLRSPASALGPSLQLLVANEVLSDDRDSNKKSNQARLFYFKFIYSGTVPY